MTIFFALIMIMDGFGGMTQQEEGKEVMKHLYYPLYFLIIVRIAKLSGSITILQNKFKTIKEWAYAGFAINFIGAFASRAFVGDRIGLLVPRIIALLIFITYILWIKYDENVKNS